MLKFNKDFNAKIVSLSVAVLFLFNSAVHGIGLPRNTPPDKLRVPVGEADTNKRLIIGHYLKKAMDECIIGSKKVFEGFWQNPEIVDYYWASLPAADELTAFLTNKIADLASKKGKVLIVGGAAGRLGRYIAQKHRL